MISNTKVTKSLTELQDLFQLLEKLGFIYWLDFGQLLGAYRENKTLKWDNDIDFCVICNTEEDWLRLRKIVLSELKPKFKQAIPKKLLRVEKDGWSIDFFRAVQNGEWVDLSLYDQNMSMKSSFFDGLEKIFLDDVQFKCPKNLPLYLQIRYGDDWVIPKVKNCRNVRKNPRQDLQFK
jgi:phosphorylcholine metabolism protein LicD